MKLSSTSKKIILSLGMILALSSFSFAQESSEPDEYVEPVKTEAASDEYEETTEVKKKTAKKEKGSSNPIKDFFFGKEKYIFFDSTDLSTGTITFGIKPRTAQVILNPKTGMAGVQTYFQTAFFNILFDEGNRAEIADAVSKYLDDFENKNLIKNKTMQTRKAYFKKGKTHIEWGSVKTMMDCYGDARFTLGYEFKKFKEKTSPYFCIIIDGCKNDNSITENRVKNSIEVELYFTKAQAKRLVELLSRESINDQLAEYFQVEKASSDDFDSATTSDSNY